MAKSIWERRLELECSERIERSALLEPLIERYRPLYEALQRECESSDAGHQWNFKTFGVVGQRFFSCNFCGLTMVED